jgi:DNA polymerase III subunit delta'
MLIPWFEPILAELAQRLDRLPHALLLVGPAGVGKRVLARSIARMLLCESADAAMRAAGGCGACVACQWFDQGHHPDYRRVTTEAIAEAEGAEAAEDGETVDEDTGTRSKRAPSREIRITQILGMQRFFGVGTHRGRSRVVVLYPLETLNDIAANALLKTLEEPPPATVFLLVADRPGRVAPTIVSRCQKLAVPMPPAAQAAAWLAQEGVRDAAEVLALAGGAPFTALELASDPAALAQHRELVAFLSAPSLERAMATAEQFARAAPGPLVQWMQLWLADCIASRLAGRVRYHPAQGGVIGTLSRAAKLDALFAASARIDATRRTIDHPLNVRLVLESLFVAYATAMEAGRPIQLGTPA